MIAQTHAKDNISLGIHKGIEKEGGIEYITTISCDLYNLLLNGLDGGIFL